MLAAIASQPHNCSSTPTGSVTCSRLPRRSLSLGAGGVEIALWAFPGGPIGGRIYFDVTTPSQIPNRWWGVFAVWDGGLSIWGGVLGGVLTGLWVARRRLNHEQLLQLMDVVGPALLVSQSIGRIGNYFKQELFGTIEPPVGR
jgi:prolipoprotein diacylglyceryltransferase